MVDTPPMPLPLFDQQKQ
jgi:hypothetical protein